MEKERSNFKKKLILILVAIIGFWIVTNMSTVSNLISNIFNIIFPFVLGGCLAFVLNIPMTFFERNLLKIKSRKSKKQKNKKIIRIISILFAIIVILLIFVLIINLIVPELVNIVSLLIDNIPYYVEEINKLMSNYGENILEITNLIQNADTENIKNEILNKIPTILTSSISVIKGIISGIATFFIAIVFAIYVLIDKEKLLEQSKKILHAYLPKEKSEKIINGGKVVNSTFRNFFTVQCLEACILGILCCIGMLILKVPYAIPISILIGVTALIPIVGAFIGVIVGAILILSVNPFKVITFVVFVLILQQIEGNLIYPRVVGNKVGLPGIWVLVAVSLGGSIGGILGMLLGVPIASIIYTLLRKNVNEKLDNENSSCQ